MTKRSSRLTAGGARGCARCAARRRSRPATIAQVTALPSESCCACDRSKTPKLCASSARIGMPDTICAGVMFGPLGGLDRERRALARGWMGCAASMLPNLRAAHSGSACKDSAEDEDDDARDSPHGDHAGDQAPFAVQGRLNHVPDHGRLRLRRPSQRPSRRPPARAGSACPCRSSAAASAPSPRSPRPRR